MSETISTIGWKPDQACLDHWAKIRAQIKSASPTLPADWKPPLTLAESADRQIAILERDLAEWRKIKAEQQP